MSPFGPARYVHAKQGFFMGAEVAGLEPATW